MSWIETVVTTTVKTIICDADFCKERTRVIDPDSPRIHHHRLSADMHYNCIGRVKGEDVRTHAMQFFNIEKVQGFPKL
jgi:hypothetical protein